MTLKIYFLNFLVLKYHFCVMDYLRDEEGYVIVEFVQDGSLDIKRENMSNSSWLDVLHLPEELLSVGKSFDVLWNLHPTAHNEVVMYGKSIPIPRFQQAYLKDYSFSGTVSKVKELPVEFIPYMEWVNSLGYGEFNSFLVNWYENGENYIGPHADNTAPLVPDSPIVTITLCAPGEERKFRLRDIKTKKVVKDVLTPNGIVLIMGGKFQKEFKHEIVKITGPKAQKAGARISITLRQFK